MTARLSALASWMLILALLLSAGGCGPGRHVHAAEEIDPAVLAAGMKFGLALHRQLAGEEPGENVFISPASVAMALYMTLNGAAGSTRDAMMDALSLQGLEVGDVNRASADLLTLFRATIAGIEVGMANSLWAREGIGFNPGFLSLNAEHYHAHVQALNFDDPAAPGVINSWVSQQTRGMIDGIVDQIDHDAVLFLINALYFRGEWTQAFDPGLTADRPFHAVDGTITDLPMMHMSSDLMYLERAEFQAVRLPYGTGRMSMYVFLPAAGLGIDGFHGLLTAGAWSEWMDGFSTARVDLNLPRFSLEFDRDLSGALKALGMEIAFDDYMADFSNMRPIPPVLFIGSVRHRAAIEVTEEGTEAAAATSVEIKVRSAPVAREMVVDRPFFFAIRDDITGALLFTGSVVTP